MSQALTKRQPRGLIPRIQAAWKSFLYGPGDNAVGWGGYASWPYWSNTYGTSIDYTVEAGDLSQNAIIMACIQSIMRAFPEAPLRVMRESEGGSQVVPGHPLTLLLKRPNPYFSGRLLWQATVFSLNLAGNAYWIKVRNGGRKVVELWYEPHFSIRCRWDGGEFISYYEVYRAGQWYRVEAEDVVHFRFGIDPSNIRYGLSPLASALREVFTDNEAARYSSTVLRNMGIPGVVIAPKAGESIANPELLKLQFMQKFGGDKRGEPLVSADVVDISVLSFSPEQMSLQALRRIPEERIPALLSWPAVVAGLGAGLDRSTYNNMDEARQQAYEQNIIPTQMILADDLGTQLLPDFSTTPDREMVNFDLSQVRVLQDDQFKLYQRLDIGFKGGWLKRSEVRQATGWPVNDAEDAVYITAIPVRSMVEAVNAPEPVKAWLEEFIRGKSVELLALGTGEHSNGNGSGGLG